MKTSHIAWSSGRGLCKKISGAVFMVTDANQRSRGSHLRRWEARIGFKQLGRGLDLTIAMEIGQTGTRDAGEKTIPL
jgi:hypothetical protein